MMEENALFVCFIALEALSVHPKQLILSGIKLHIRREVWENSFSQYEYACQLDYLKLRDHKVPKCISSSSAEISPCCHTRGKMSFYV